MLVRGRGVLESDHTAAQRPQVRHDLYEVERGVRRLKTLALKEERERAGRQRGQFGFRGHVE